MVTGDGYGKSRSCFSLNFFFWGMVTGDFLGFLVFLNFFFWGMVTGDGYGKSRFSCFSLNFFFWGMVTGDGYGRWLREVSVFLFFS